MNGKHCCLDNTGQHGRGQCKKFNALKSFALRQFVEHMIGRVFFVTQCELQRGSRGRAEAAFARQVAMYLSHVTFGLSMHDVGLMFERDRTTVAHACAVIEDRRDEAEFDLTMDLLASALQLAIAKTDTEFVDAS